MRHPPGSRRYLVFAFLCLSAANFHGAKVALRRPAARRKKVCWERMEKHRSCRPTPPPRTLNTRADREGRPRAIVERWPRTAPGFVWVVASATAEETSGPVGCTLVCWGKPGWA
ncbi:MAG: hypothetical protein BJ554DRAFT_1532 [Olpidium bornovanus]|uniref:Secreted protein n=1 Tax=Olpidium bornovanus TaxID=278681 RepID=A0A8H8DHM1_9FUNG|nr:MAG: hypothetical protein BJ554DRAFT_1532 [Olpidium bornovanus]